MTFKRICDQITEETWTQGVLARDKYDRQVLIDDENAIKWCAVGWVMKTYRSLPARLNIWRGFEILTKTPRVATFNDRSTFKEVKAIFDELGV